MKKTKKISTTFKYQLQYLVEEFLEKSGKEITAKIVGHGDAAKTMWERLEGTLFANIFWMDEPDSQDMTESDYEKSLKKYHAVLKPVWNQFRDALFDYKYGIIPDREDSRQLLKTIDRDKASPIFEYKVLFKQQDTALDLEKFYDISLKKSFESGTLTISFEPGHVTFYKRKLDVINNLVDLLSGVDNKHFGRCEYCSKCIVLKRSDKRFCPICAAKKHQKDKWESDPEGMREKERLRYRQKRKKR
ncbi:MAG: hypothetical protein ACQ9MH_17085 [Nitrospinales bacterium]